jgi:hypothetical protein
MVLSYYYFLHLFPIENDNMKTPIVNTFFQGEEKSLFYKKQYVKRSKS